MRDGRYLIGMGMATATYPTLRAPSTARVRIFKDGTAVVQAAASDMGPGTWTMMKIVASIPRENAAISFASRRITLERDATIRKHDAVFSRTTERRA